MRFDLRFAHHRVQQTVFFTSHNAGAHNHDWGSNLNLQSPHLWLSTLTTAGGMHQGRNHVFKVGGPVRSLVEGITTVLQKKLGLPILMQSVT